MPFNTLVERMNPTRDPSRTPLISVVMPAYETDEISERHRHRYEFNNDYKEAMEDEGLVFSGINADTGLVEIIELPTHPWFIGVQYHPEYKSTVANPHPLFVGFIEAVRQHKLQRTDASLA